jgi:hypothetical protein
MKKHLALIAALGLATTLASAAPRPVEVRLDGARVLASDWIAKKTDNIVGLKDVNQLSHPAKLDFDRCLAATPEMKQMKDEGIGADSPEGIRLRTAGVNRVTRATNTVRTAGGYCSVWKTIAHKDGRRVPDLTSRVIAQY